jgi:amidohydrolase
MITAQILVTLQQIVSRKANPSLPTVLSFGKVMANGAFNVIPDDVSVEGTFRTMDETWRTEAHAQMIKMATAIADGMGGRCDFRIVRGYPFLINEKVLTGRIRSYAEEYLGKENVIETDIWMAAEDFAYYSQEADACFYLLGIANQEKGINSSLHTPTFNIDENALAIGSGLMAYLAVKELGN